MGDLKAHERRRHAYMKAIGTRACAILHSPPEVIRNGDAHYPFRQSSDVYYLTGFVEPETTVVLRPGAEQPFVLFVRPRDPEREVWDGRRAGTEGAVEHFGADVAYPADELEKRLPELLDSCTELHYSLGIDPEFDRMLCRTLGRIRRRERRGQRTPDRVIDAHRVLHELRLLKDADEVALLKRAAEITASAHTEAMRSARAGVHEYELEATINHTFRRLGGMGPGYSSIVGAGVNATILHYIENDKVLEDGELVLIDAGCELDHYTADVTRTFPVNGTFSTPQKRVYEIVLAAQKEAIEMTRPGISLEDIHARCVEILTEGMIELGLLEGTAKERIDDGSYKRYYLHRTSHWLGMDVHDVGAYTDDEGEVRPLSPGMVITIEPGLYIADDDDGAPEELRGIGVRIEDDVLITKSGAENLTADTPKEVKDVEAACRA